MCEFDIIEKLTKMARKDNLLVLAKTIKKLRAEGYEVNLLFSDHHLSSCKYFLGIKYQTRPRVAQSIFDRDVDIFRCALSISSAKD